MCFIDILYSDCFDEWMPHSLSNVLLHIVFGTKFREHRLRFEWRHGLYAYIDSIVGAQGGQLIAMNYMGDHIHLLVALTRTQTVSDLVKGIKTGTSRWIRLRGSEWAHFCWQGGYGAFSISIGHKERVTKYIANQQAHHKTEPFDLEYKRLLNENKIEYNEPHIWT